MGMIRFEFEVFDLLRVKSVVEANSQSRKLKIVDDDVSNDPVEFEVTSLEWDEKDPKRLVLRVMCSFPKETVKFPKWFRGDVRRAWQSCVEHPIVDIDIVDSKDLDPNYIERHIEEVTNWLFNVEGKDE